MTSVRLYDLWKASSFQTLPYAGGWLDQPAWVLDDFESLMLLEEAVELHADLPQAAHLPRIDDMVT